MFSIKWSKDGNFPLLSESVDKVLHIHPPRPVFYQELDLFEFHKYWDYQSCEEPLLWAIGRSYYYGGVEVARVNGGSLTTEPCVEVIHKGVLEPIDLGAMLNANKTRLATLENEAKFYIKNIVKRRNSNEQLSVAYSGGKDSQVVLELVSQVIAPGEYVVIYTNTGMELPNNPKIVDEAIKNYITRFPELRFEVAQPNIDMVENWNIFGPPSRMQRWCCKVAKSVPFYVALSKLSSHSKFIVFEGVRKEESNARSNYERTADQVKHSRVKNVRPIIDWNDTEVYMYLFYCGCTINPLYRMGLTRVGCSICPFSSDWSEYIVSKLNPLINDKFYDVITKSFEFNGISEAENREKYLKEGKWKVRGGDKILHDIGSSIRMTPSGKGYDIRIKNPKTLFIEWIKIFDYHISNRGYDGYDLSIKRAEKTSLYTIRYMLDGFVVHFKGGNSLQIDNNLKKMLNKVTFCSSCLCCLVECPTGAISFSPQLTIDQNLCIQCHNCLDAVEKGCLVASSRSITIKGDAMGKKTHNPDRYSTFGLREKWLISFFSSNEEWFDSLGSKQIPAVKRWLMDCELMGRGGETELAHIVATLPLEKTWGVVWVNLCYNSEIIRWYHKVDFIKWDRDELQSILIKDYEKYSEGTVKNPFNAMLNMFDSSDILSDYYGQGLVKKKGNRYVGIHRKGINSIADCVLIYAIYKYGNYNQKNSLILRELCDSDNEYSLKRIFGIDPKSVMNQLLSLQEHRSKLLRVEFVANLDNIFLVRDLNATEALKIYLEEQ